MQILKNIELIGASNRPFLIDVYFESNETAKPVVLFTHGFKGFKDWGHWSEIAAAFVAEGFVFVAANLSHNGTTIDAPLDFNDLEAFGENNYSKELFDQGVILDWLSGTDCEIPKGEFDPERISLIGHSRGGALSIIKASEDNRVKVLITWASVNRLDYAWLDQKQIADWEERGVYYIFNGRTGQEMPLYFQIYRDFKDNKNRFDTRMALAELEIPVLFVHGAADSGIPPQQARELHEWKAGSELKLIDEADHVFNGRHPFTGAELPKASKELVTVSTTFLKRNL